MKFVITIMSKDDEIIAKIVQISTSHDEAYNKAMEQLKILHPDFDIEQVSTYVITDRYIHP